MKIAVTADIHYGYDTKKEEFENYIEKLTAQKPDILIIAGDLAAFGATHETFDEAMEIIKKFPGMILFSPGNHDLWTREDSLFLLNEKIPAAFKNAGYQMLDGNPFISGKIGIAGTVGWYDYTFRKVPDEFIKIFSEYKYKIKYDDGTKKIFTWEELADKEYETKSVAISNGESGWTSSTWEDKRYIKWNYSDREFLNFCLEKLESDIKSIYDKVDEIIAVSHHLPFQEFVPNIPDPKWGFHRAYLGSLKIGEMFLKYPKIKKVFTGHSHRNMYLKIKGIDVWNVFFGREPGTIILNL